MARAGIRVFMAIAVVLGVAAVASRATSFAGDVVARNDFTQDYVAARAWADGANPYARTGELVERYLPTEAESYEAVYRDRRDPHPPVQIASVRPLSALPYRTARVVWLLLDAAALAAGLALIARGLGASRAGAIAIGVGSLALPVAQHDLIWAQMNGLLILLLALAWLWIRRRADIPAGVALGIMAAFKFYPAILVLALIKLRRPRAALAQIATAVVVTIAGMALLGLRASSEYLQIAAPENFAFWRAAPMNLSLVATPYRWLTESPWRPDGIDVPVLAALLAAAVIALCALAVLRTGAGFSRDPLFAALPWMLLAAPLMWSFTLSLMLPFVLAVGATAVRERQVPSLAIAIPVLVLLASPLPGLPMPGPDTSVPATLFAFGLPTYALLWLGVADLRGRERYSL